MVKKIIFWTIGIGALLLVTSFVASGFVIGQSVKDKCDAAIKQYQGECITALMQLVDDKAASFHDRNDAIWALGQLGESQSLPVLEKYYTGHENERGSYNSEISQYELMKAIKLTQGGFNATVLIWRNSVINFIP